MEILSCLRVGLQCMDGTRERDVTCLWGENKDLVVFVGVFLWLVVFFFFER